MTDQAAVDTKLDNLLAELAEVLKGLSPDDFPDGVTDPVRPYAITFALNSGAELRSDGSSGWGKPDEKPPEIKHEPTTTIGRAIKHVVENQGVRVDNTRVTGGIVSGGGHITIIVETK